MLKVKSDMIYAICIDTDTVDTGTINIRPT